MNTNPLLDFSGLPRFDCITPEHVSPAIEHLLQDSRALINALSHDTTEASWDHFVAPLSKGLERLSRAWGIVGHLHSVNDTPDWRNAYNEKLDDVSGFYAELGQNLALYSKYKAIYARSDFETLSVEQQRVIENELRDFKLSGAALPEADKPRFKAISEALARLSAKFSENLLDATKAFSEIITEEPLLSGLPRDVRDAAREAAHKEGLSGWKLTLHAPIYLPVMQYADHRPLRERFYRAYATRAAEFPPAEFDNTPLIREILKLRKEAAQLLGFANHAEVSLVPKMAGTIDDVLHFLRDLGQRARPFALNDLATLREFAANTLGLQTLEPWDIAYASEKYLQTRYAFSEQEVKEYFTEDKVLHGLFGVIQRLFQVKITRDTAPTWHEDVQFFRVSTPEGTLIGQFYLDLYARDTKRGGAWMDEAITRKRVSEYLQTPVAYINCNFSRPTQSQTGQKRPACFTHDEVLTLFHEMGHGLHHLLTRVDTLEVSGIHGVEWDAVELPSQFMENYGWEWSVIREMSAHVDTGEPLPKALFDKMLAARNFQSGLQMVRQIEFSLFDFLLHAHFDPEGPNTPLDLLQTVREEVAVLFPPVWHRFPNSFAHIFGGGYAAGYFSYKWAEVLSADCFAAFEETQDPFDPATGQRFLEEILSRGGSRRAAENFHAFRGRAPRIDALLRHNGMIG